MLIVWFFKLIANLPQLLLCEDPTPDDPVVMLAPHALIVDELVTLAVGQQFLEALHVKKRLASAPRQFHKVIQVDGDKRLIGRMVQAVGPASVRPDPVEVIELIPELFDQRMIGAQTAFPLHGPAQDVGVQPLNETPIPFREKGRQRMAARGHLSMVFNDALVLQLGTGKAGFKLRKGRPVGIQQHTLVFQCHAEESRNRGRLLLLEPAGDLPRAGDVVFLVGVAVDDTLQEGFRAVHARVLGNDKVP